MKIVHLITSLKFGGAESFLLSLSKSLNKKNTVEQIVVYFYDGPVKNEIEKLGIKTYKISGLIYRYDFYAFFKLTRLLKSLKPDIIFSSLWSANFFGTLAAKFLRIPIVCSLHTIYKKEGKLRNFLDSISLTKATKIVAVSNDVLFSASKKIKSLNTTVIPNGIDPLFVEKNIGKEPIQRTELDIPSNYFVIGAVGRFVKIKNHDLLIKAFHSLSQQYQDIILLLVGTGPEYNNLKKLTKSLNIEDKVKFIVNKQAYPYYQVFDCFAQPSEYESISIALLEAMSAKVPCISTSIDKANISHPVLKNQYNGIIINPTTTEIHFAIESLYKNKCLRNKLKANAYKTVSKFYNMDQTAECYYDLFKKITNIKDYNI